MSARALVVEPSLTIRMHLCEALQAAGFRAEACGSAAEARRAFAASPPTLIVTNASLPEGRGVDLLRELRAPPSTASLPVLLLASPDELDACAVHGAPGVELIGKPFEASDVAARARAVAGLPPAGAPAAPAASPWRRVRVLAVDDSATFRQRIHEFLEEEGYDVLTASSGEEAIACLATHDVDCVLLDMVMPGLGGEETCRLIRATPTVCAVSILILTCREGMGSIVSALRAGADDFVSKSDDFAVLEARLRAQIRRRRFEEDNLRIREELHTASLLATTAQAARELAETRARLLENLETKNVELQLAKERAEAAVQARDEFLMIASHELLTPLTPLQLHFQSLQHIVADHPEHDPLGRFSAGLDVAERQVKRFAALIEALLDASRMSTGLLELRHERFDLAAAARDVIARQVPCARRVGCTITLNAPLAVLGSWDRLRVEQVGAILISNAIKYGDGKPIEVEVGSKGDAARLVVRDHGVGIADDQRGRMFGIFERAASSRDYGGLGLGLYIARQIVEAHGGTIGVASRLGHGSTFTVELPVKSRARGGRPSGV